LQSAGVGVPLFRRANGGPDSWLTSRPRLGSASRQLLGADRACPRLFDPRLVALSTNIIRFVGFERTEDAWVMQEWECEVLAG
jgi:hypothetical protein